MDYHNNEIGRELYQRLATFKRFLGAAVGVRNPSNATIYEEAFKQIENNSVFIDMEILGQTEDEQEEAAYLRI